MITIDMEKFNKNVNVIVEGDNFNTSLDIDGNTTQDSTPTPDNPQTIHSISGSNTIKVNGKNLIPLTNQNITINNVNFKANNGNIKITGTANDVINGFNFENDNWKIILPAGTYTISRNIQSISLGLFDGNNSYGTLSSTSSSLNTTFTINETKILYLYFYIGSGTNVNTDYNLQIEKGSTVSDYEEYKGVTIPLSTEELCKIGTYKDTLNIDLESGVVSKTGNIGKVVLDGTEDWTVAGENNYQAGVYSLTINTTEAIAQNNSLCSHYSVYNKYVQVSNSYAITNDFIRLRNESGLSLADWKTWLSNNNVTIYYAMATPTTSTITTLSSSDLVTLKNILNGETITVTANLDTDYTIVQSYKVTKLITVVSR